MGLTTWTDDETRFVIEGWQNGLSSGVLASHLPGRTRNSVIGKVHRLGLMERKPRVVAPKRPPRPRIQPPPVKAVSKPATHAPRRPRVWLKGTMPKPPQPPVEIAVPSDATHVTLLQRKVNQCAWPIGETDGPDTIFCGAPKGEAGPYCLFHRKIAYKPNREARPKRPTGPWVSA